MRLTDEMVEKSILPVVPIEDWVDPKPGESHWSANQLIVANEPGVNAGAGKAVVAHRVWAGSIGEKNIDKAGNHTRHILDFLHRKGMHPKSAILNTTQFNCLRVLILLPLEEYVGEVFKGVYSEVGKRELEWEESNYSIEFMFSSFDGNINEGLLRADGFILHHTSLFCT